MRILLLNETGTWPHVGCLAVADAHARMLGSMGHVVARRPVGTLGHLSRAGTGDAADLARTNPDFWSFGLLPDIRAAGVLG